MTLRDKLKFWILLSNYIQMVVRGTSPLSLPDALDDKLLDLKAYGDCENRNLPEGYQELEYIEGHNNAQYINTGIVPTSSMNMYFKGQFISVDASTPNQVSFLAGARDVGGQYGFFIQLAATNVGLDWFVVNGRWTENHTRAVGDVVEMKVSNSLAQIWINGTSVGTHQYTPNDTTQYPLFLNGLNSVGQPFDTNVNVVNRIYRFTIDGIADMRPARRLSDGVLGMYDTIRKRFFTNAGTGSFVAGRDISAEPLPTGYTRLAYIESNGTQYIDTGLKVDQNTEIETVFQRTQLSNYFIYGINNAGGLDACSAYVTGTDTAHYWRFDDEYVNMQDVGGIIDTMWHRTIQNKNGVKLDSKNILAYTSIGTFETPVNMPIFCRYTTASSEYTGFAYVRISSFVMRKNGTDILNLVPAKRNSDSAIGMYDTVSDTFFANAGTGTFAYAEYPTPTAPQDIWCNNGAIKAIRPIKYLESTGTQYIDTGIVPNQDTSVELDGSIDGYGIFFGVRTAALVDISTIQGTSTGYWAMGYNTSADAFGSKDSLRHVWYKDKNKQYMDGELKNNYTYANFTAMGNAYLFAYNNNGTVGYVINGRVRVYSCKIWDGDTLVRDFIPALDINNIPCMFDKVEGKCYYNAGTGQFIAGYLPAEYEELDYIQSDGDQYIDTGVKYTNTSHKAVVKFSTVSAGSGSAPYWIFGSFASGAKRSGGLALQAGGQIGVGVGDIGVGSTTYTINNPLDPITVTVECSGNTFSVSGGSTNYSGVSFTGTSISQYNEYLFAGNNTGSVGTSVTTRIYRATFYDNGAIVADMIPVIKLSNGHIGMYDLIRRQFFENAGSGSFTMGKLPILPDGYTQLEYIQGTGTQWIDTGVKATGGAVIEAKGRVINDQFFVGSIASRDGNPDTTRNMVLYNAATTSLRWQKLNLFGTGRQTVIDPTKDFVFNFNTIGSAFNFALNGTLIKTETTGTLDTQPNTIKLLNSDWDGVVSGRFYWCKLYSNTNMLVRYLIPAKRNSDGVVGMYDIMNDVFLTNQGTGDFEYGAEIPTETFDSYYVDGVVEKVGTRSAGNKNLFNGVFEQGGLYQGNLVVADTRIRTPDYITFPAGTYTISCASAYEVWIEKNNTSSVNWYSSYTFTATSTDKFKIAVRSKTDPSTTVIRPDDPVNVQVEAGSTATAYVPYCDGGLAVCENLLGIGSTQDVQEILTGEITRKFGVKVFDGSESWEYASGLNRFHVTLDVKSAGTRLTPMVCTHFTSYTAGGSYADVPNNAIFTGAIGEQYLYLKSTDYAGVTQLTAFLRQQYDNGTPVIVVYPLSADETESVAGQTLTVSAGNNTAEIIQASIDGLEIEAKYLKRM